MADTKGWPKAGSIVEMDRFVVETRKFCILRKVPEYLIQQALGVGLNAEIQRYVEQETNNMIIKMHTHILGLDGKKETTTKSGVEYPLTVWDHFKSRFFEEWAHFERWPLRNFGRWFLGRWPVRYTSEPTLTEITEYRLCPHCTEKWEDNKRAHLEWLMRKDEQ